ncbi:MAG: FAD-dependent oxidoreductase [Verrucomicrobiota bacterium]
MNARVDIAVVGAGAAGLAAAVCAARAGANTLLVDARSAPGGTGGFSGLTTLCGLYDDAGNFLNEGFAREFAEALTERGAPLRMGRVWVLPYRPEKFREVAAQLVAATPKLRVQWSAPLKEVICESERITKLNGIAVGAVIDCTGTAEIATTIGVETFATDESTQASAVIFPLRHVARALGTAADMAQVLLPLARAGFPPLNLQASPGGGEFTAKFAGTPEQVPQLLTFLRNNVPGFEQCDAPQQEFTLSRRAGRMIVGQYVLSGPDVLAGRKFPDAVARCAWPIEQWDAKGAVRFKYLPAGKHYEIPARALRAAQVENIFMAGKTLSADVDAIASARVMGCCLATGAAAGVLAAKFVNSSRIR